MRTRMFVVLAACVLAVLASGCQAIAAIPAALIISNSQSSPRVTIETSMDYSNVAQGRTEDGAFILGDPSAPVTVIAFEDFLCPHCQEYQTTINQLITEQVLTGKARFEYRFMPAIDPNYSFLAANLTECAETLAPESFWKAHDVMFAINEQVRFGPDMATIFADQMGLDETALMDCASSGDHQIDVDRAYGDTLGVQGTPTVFIQSGTSDPVMLSARSYSDLVAAIESAPAGK